MFRKLLWTVGPLLAIICVPVLLRTEDVEDNPSADQLVIVSPHNEAIRFEFERAFREHYRQTHGRDVDVDWRTPGGTTEIVRYIHSEYLSRFRLSWTDAGHEWSAEVQHAVLDRKLKAEDASPEAWKARQMFLSGDVGIGIDLFFGGGQYDFGKMASQGILVPGGLEDRRPEIFAGNPAVFERGMSGETWRDDQGRYYGACLSAFGICYNLDRLRELGIDPRSDPPRTWRDFGDPRYFSHVGAADPSKSGSITKCFEMLIQQIMQESVTRRTGKPIPRDVPADALDAGWRDALLLVKQLGGNARYFTLSASRVPVEVGTGDLAVGMCIDFYGRSQAEWTRNATGRDVMRYVTPVGGSSISADPIGLLRGAPHAELAREFIDFVLSPAGQRLWNYRVGTEGGPEQYALRRLPIRRDMFSTEDLGCMSDPDAEPFQLAERFEYQGAWTGPLFNLIRVLIRVMIIDCHQELKDGWSAIIETGGPGANPEAMEALSRLPFEFHDARDVAGRMGTSTGQLEVTREWVTFFRAAYADARAATGKE